jgi:hypothetical protein
LPILTYKIQASPSHPEHDSPDGDADEEPDSFKVDKEAMKRGNEPMDLAHLEGAMLLMGMRYVKSVECGEFLLNSSCAVHHTDVAQNDSLNERKSKTKTITITTSPITPNRTIRLARPRWRAELKGLIDSRQGISSSAPRLFLAESQLGAMFCVFLGRGDVFDECDRRWSLVCLSWLVVPEP